MAPLSKKQLRGSLPLEEQERLSIRAGYNRHATLANAADKLERGIDQVTSKIFYPRKLPPGLRDGYSQQDVATWALALDGDLR